MEEPNLGQETRTPSEAAVNNGVKIGTVGPEVLTGSKTIKFEITIGSDGSVYAKMPDAVEARDAHEDSLTR